MLQAMLSLAATRETSGDSSKGKIRMASRIKSHRKDTCTFSVFHFIHNRAPDTSTAGYLLEVSRRTLSWAQQAATHRFPSMNDSIILPDCRRKRSD